MDDRRYRLIGKSLPRPDAWEKVRGRPIYAGDLALSGMLHGLIGRIDDLPVQLGLLSALLSRDDTRVPIRDLPLR